MSHRPGAERYSHKRSRASSHDTIVRLLGNGRGKTCVDAGCASGYLCEELRRNNWRVIGIEPDPRAAALARNRCDALIESDLEDVDFDAVGSFQAIVFGDVLEHLAKPEDVLRRSVHSLDAGGVVIASVPNIAFLLMRLSLLAGHFDYTERGILDRTHLRFFTRRTIGSFLEENGVSVISIDATVPPVELVLRGRWASVVRPLRAILIGLGLVWPTAFAYQFVCRGMKKSAGRSA